MAVRGQVRKQHSSTPAPCSSAAGTSALTFENASPLERTACSERPPTPRRAALVLEVRPARRGVGGRSLHAVLSSGDAFSKVKALVPAAELQGAGVDECCFLTCPRAATP